MAERFDILVAGAGVAGVCAAIQAGRAGAKTLLVEKNGMPGGTATVGAVAYPGIFDAWGRQVIGGIGWELVAKTLDAMGRERPDFASLKDVEEHWRHQFSINPLIFAAICDEEMLSASVEIAYHSMIGRAIRTDDGWRVTICEKDGLYDVDCKMLIDCTGDANLVHIAGYETMEPSVPSDCQPGTFTARLLNVDRDSLDYEELAKAYYKAAASGDVNFRDLGWNEENAKKGIFQFVLSNSDVTNHIADIVAADSARRTQIEIAGRQSIMRAYRFLKGLKGLENIEIAMTASECGVRETRTIVGEYTITEEDYVSGRSFDDALCYSFYPIDIHHKEGLHCHMLYPGIVPQVPLRSLIPLHGDAILAAGRIISSDHAANSALRIQATCMATGQAAAAAAVCAIQGNVTLVQVSIPAVKELLLQHGAIVP